MSQDAPLCRVPHPHIPFSYPLDFVANELDGWNGTNRNHIDSYVPQQDLVDSYLPSFQTCVEEGKVSGIMVRRFSPLAHTAPPAAPYPLTTPLAHTAPAPTHLTHAPHPLHRTHTPHRLRTPCTAPTHRTHARH